LQDPRTQGIPLILETPSFEQPRDVWGAEIKVLERISQHEEDAAEKATPTTDATGSHTLATYIKELRDAVRGAEKVHGLKKTPRPTKRKARVLREDDEGDEDFEDFADSKSVNPKSKVGVGLPTKILLESRKKERRSRIGV